MDPSTVTGGRLSEGEDMNQRVKALTVTPATVPNLSRILEVAKVDTATLLDPATVKDARILWAEFRKGYGFKGNARILTYPEGQLKLGKSEIYTLGLTLSSGDAAGVETCSWRGECSKVCVLKHGKGGLPAVQRARIARTQFAESYPREFFALVAEEINTAHRKHGEIVVRLNVNSDLRFYRAVPGFFNGSLFGEGVRFYDYTKNPAILNGDGWITPLYRAVYSMHEGSNPVKVAEFLKRGGTVAMVTDRPRKGDTLPLIEVGGEMFGTVDGDSHDNRLLDPAGVIVDLYAKGAAVRNPGEFVRKVYGRG